jgi:hypothetical protein
LGERAKGFFVSTVIAKRFFRSGTPDNPPCPPLKKGGKYKELQEKSPFEISYSLSTRFGGRATVLKVKQFDPGGARVDGFS